MTYQLIDTEMGSVNNLHCIEIHCPSSFQLLPVTVYAEQTQADWIATVLSREMPNAVIKIVFLSQVKAVYVNGERISIIDVKDHYPNLNEEDLQASRLLVGAREWK